MWVARGLSVSPCGGSGEVGSPLAMACQKPKSVNTSASLL